MRNGQYSIALLENISNLHIEKETFLFSRRTTIVITWMISVTRQMKILDSEDKNAMTLDTVKLWLEMMWESRFFAGTQGMILEFLIITFITSGTVV